MKAHYRTKSKTNTSNLNHKKSCQYGSRDPDRIAEELERLARQHLPDRVLQAVMTGYEQDIRQDAILLALSWYLREGTSTNKHSGHAWHAPRAVAGALKIIKRDYIKALKGEAEALQAILPHVNNTTCHPVMIPSCDWPTSTMRGLTRKAIHMIHRTGKISSLNAAIAIEVLADGVPASETAARLGVHRSNVYQHLDHTRKHLHEIMAKIEVSLRDVQ